MKKGKRVPANKGRTYHAEILTDEEVQALLKRCSKRAPTGLRNRALIVMLYRGGLRINEALSLGPKDLDAKAGTVRVLKGKGRKARTVGLDAGAFAVVERWLEARSERGINGHHRSPLFCTLKGEDMEAAYVRALLPRLARKAGIEKRVHAHGLRHTHAAQLASEGVPINVIQVQLGHSNAATTSRYIQHIAPQEVIAAMQKRVWSADDTAPGGRGEGEGYPSGKSATVQRPGRRASNSAADGQGQKGQK